jgi:hypothetical protein
MAKRVIHELVDDLDGKAADETVEFGLDGVRYEIDLSAKNATRLREALAPYITAGARVGRVGGTAHRVSVSRGGGPARADRDQNRAIRDWATAKGIEVSERGRIKQDVVDRYHAEAGRRR